jgi:hypothetical protein
MCLNRLNNNNTKRNALEWRMVHDEQNRRCCGITEVAELLWWRSGERRCWDSIEDGGIEKASGRVKGGGIVQGGGLTKGEGERKNCKGRRNGSGPRNGLGRRNG